MKEKTVVTEVSSDRNAEESSKSRFWAGLDKIVEEAHEIDADAYLALVIKSGGSIKVSVNTEGDLLLYGILALFDVMPNAIPIFAEAFVLHEQQNPYQGRKLV